MYIKMCFVSLFLVAFTRKTIRRKIQLPKASHLILDLFICAFWLSLIFVPI